jgi:hypothetical protein
MHFTSTSSKSHSPAEFVLGCIALNCRFWGAQLITPLARMRALLPFMLISLIVLAVCDSFFNQFWWAFIFVETFFTVFILFTFHKKANNFADRLAAIAKEGLLLSGTSVLSIIPAVLAKFSSRVLPVPTTPPRCTAA